MGQADLEALVDGVGPEQTLPVIYLRLEPTEDGMERFATAYPLRRRANGFLVLVPDAELVRDFLDNLMGDDGEALALMHREQVHAETVRGRQLGPAHIILVDLSWSCAERFVRSHPLRGAQDRNVRLTALSVGGTGGRPSSGDALDAAARWVEQLDPDTAQEYFESAQEAVEGSVDGEPFEEEGAGEPLLERAPAPQPALPRRTARTTPAATPGSLFRPAGALDPAQLQRLQGLAGLAPPRAGGVERAAGLDQGSMADLRMES